MHLLAINFLSKRFRKSDSQTDVTRSVYYGSLLWLSPLSSKEILIYSCGTVCPRHPQARHKIITKKVEINRGINYYNLA
jgi:hypothetical protein